MKQAFALTSLLVISFAVCSPAFREIRAQQTQQEQPLRLKSELVEFDVVVTDKNDRPVTDLKKEDFILLEEGKAQPVSFFSLVRPGQMTSADQRPSKQLSQASAFNPDPSRFIFLILDPYYISRDNFPRLREALLKFINEDLTPQDQLAIISTSGNLAVFQQVTKNKRMLSLAINAFLGGRTDYNSAGAMDEAIAASQRELGNLASTSLSSLPFKEYTLRATLNALVNIAKGVANVPGRKIAIFVSEYLPIQIGDDRSVADNLFSELQEVISRSRQGSLTFYTLDPRGLATTIPGGSASEYQGKSALGSPSALEDPGASADRLLNSRTGLRELAAATGGSAILNHNDLHLGLQLALAENQAYYSLAYYPLSPARDGKFRRVKIQIKNRPDLTVKARKGYIAATEESKKDKPESKQDQIKQALGSVVPVRNIRVSIPRSAVVKSPETGQSMVKMVIQVDAISWPFKQEGDNHLASLEVIGFAYDLNNKLVDGFSKTLNLKLAPDTYSTVLREGINMHGEIKLKKAGLYNIRVVAQNRDTGEIGTSSAWVEAP